ncbi:MAG: FtsX-like permease family protein [Lentisphaerae bacterium]|nr:FtsX-like permease family protein [Lentisphaerota bacterium]
MIPFPLFLALKYLRPKRSFVSVVTIISVLGVLLGVAILVIVMAVMTGFDNMWREKILSFKPHLIVVNQMGIIRGENELSERLIEIPGIIGVAPCIQTQVLVSNEKGTSAPIAIGIDPVRAASVTKAPHNMVAGKFDLTGDSVVVGIDEANRLGLEIGDKLLVYSEVTMQAMSNDEFYLPEELVVTGIFDMGMQKFDAGVILVSLRAARDLVGLETGAYAIYLMTEDPFRFGEYAESVRAELDLGYAVRSWKDEDRVLFEALSHEKGLMGALLGIITIVAIFCVTNTLIVITYQKTNEIGLLKALGVSSWKIMGAFVWLGWIQCIVGTIGGIAVGFLVLHNLSRIAGFLSRINVEAFPKEIYGLSEIPWMTSGRDISFIALFVMISCTLISLIPAARAVWLDPVEALHHE